MKGEIEMLDKEYIQKIIEAEQRSKSNTHRLDKLEGTIKDIYNLTSSINAIAVEMKAMREDVNKIDNRVIAIEGKNSSQTMIIRLYIEEMNIPVIKNEMISDVLAL